ncbi:aquaporin Z [Geothermobacter ehrlichii]|uniref:Aquaporin Z n=1 Tax=Geothermobacter ehrlichii TaxID=213224 RepID=A0A5D3WNX4_9BACT|nr:aquaporin [Geothermobacter ehrlichii]TYO99349.1 aquaporin Z [Geothermobacter ehrlichii]
MPLMQRCVGEVIGTFALVFAGTGAVVIDKVYAGAVGHVGIALTFGLVVTAMIYSFGELSGAHFNPAVTVGFACTGRFSWREVPAYLGGQVTGALFASLLLHATFPQNADLGMTLPKVTPELAFVWELVLTFLLMLVILQVATGSKEQGLMAGVAIGGTVALEALFAGPITGASMNPARSLAPALVAGHLHLLWLYIVAPVAGALLAVLAWRCMRRVESVSA